MVPEFSLFPIMSYGYKVEKLEKLIHNS